MKKHILFVALLAATTNLFSQLTGTYTIPNPSGYLTVQAAIADLNTLGVGSGGVTFNVTAGHAETFTTATAGTIVASGTAANPIVFQKSGTGNNPEITAGVGTSSTDGIIEFAGCDYITFNGFNLKENSTNNTNTKRMEWGFGLLRKNNTAPFDGCSNIIISNCSVTLTSTYTSTRGIYSGNHTPTSTGALTITTPGDNHQNCSFSNNTISGCNQGISLNGFNASAPYTLYDQSMKIGVDGGNTISNFPGGKGIYTLYQNNLQIGNNTITEATGSNTTIYGIQVSTAYRAPVTIFNNTISLKNGTSVATNIYGIACASGSTTPVTGCSVKIYDNAIQNCSYGVTNATGFYGIEIQSNPDTAYITGNQIVGNTMPGATNFYGIGFSSSSNPPFVSIQDNIISDNVLTGVNASFYGVKTNASVVTFTMNQIYNNTMPNSSGIGACYLAGYYSNSALTPELISNNTIYGLQIGGTNTHNANRIDGIYSDSDITRTITGNTICDLTTMNGYVTGIRALTGYNIYIGSNTIHALTSQAGASTNTAIRAIDVNTYDSLFIFNNYISDLNTLSANSAHAISGIYIGGNPGFGQKAYVQYNTVYIKATSTGALFGTSALYSGYSGYSTNLQLVMQNNILMDHSTPNDFGKAAAFRRGGVPLPSYSTLSNNNNLYAGSPGPDHVLYFDGFNTCETIDEYRVWMETRDQESFTENTHFVNTTTAPYNLHIDPLFQTSCESGGLEVTAPLPVLTDADNDPRYPSAGYPDQPAHPAVAPDVGADEFAGIHLDVFPPAISYTSLLNTGYTGHRYLIAEITDGNPGIPTAGIGLPVLYWRVRSLTTGDWQAATGTYITPGQYQFEFGATAVEGDTVEYYIVAQDLSTPPNLAVAPHYDATGLTANPPACSNVPYPEVYYIASMCGEYYVGAGQEFKTLNEAISALGEKEVTCPVTLLLTDSVVFCPTYYLYPYLGSSSSNTVTIKPAPGTNVWLAGYSNNGIFCFVGGSNYIIDGSNLPGGITHNMVLQNNYDMPASIISFLNIGTLGENLTIRNCSLLGSNFNDQTTGITNENVPTDSLVIQNNRIWNVNTGISLSGTSTNSLDGCLISGNTIGSLIDTLQLSYQGIYVAYTNNLAISSNLVNGVLAPDDSPIGIEVGEGNTGTQIVRNTISDIRYTGTDDYGGTGLWIDTGLPESDVLVANNVISGISGTGSTSLTNYAITGIKVTGSTGGINLLYNSVNLSGEINGQYDGQSSAALFLDAATENISLQNNVFKNTLTDVTASDALAYALYCNTTLGPMPVVDHNCYFVEGDQGIMAYVNGADFFSVEELSLATGTDASSIDSDPQFTNELTLIPAATSPLLGAGVPIPEITTDFAGMTRSDANPSIGAYENGIGLQNTLTVKLWLEGLYEGGGLMRKLQNQSGPVYNGTTADLITIELRDPANYQNTIHTIADAALSTVGNCTVSVPEHLQATYYITIKSRNHLETTSANPVSLEPFATIADFTQPAMVYGANLKAMDENHHVLFGGDVNQDGSIDPADVTLISVLATGFQTGNLPEDANGDGAIDAADLIITDNNASLTVQKITP